MPDHTALARLLGRIREGAEDLVSLDRERRESASGGAQFADLVGGFVPGLGTAQAARDVASDFKAGKVGLGTAFAAATAIPVFGGAIRAVTKLRKAKKAAEAAADARRATAAKKISDQARRTEQAAAKAKERAEIIADLQSDSRKIIDDLFETRFAGRVQP